MAGFSVDLRSLHKQSTVRTAHGLTIQVGAVFDLADKPDLLLVPGGGWIDRSAQGAWSEAKKGIILECLKACAASGVILAAVCTGSLLLAKAGLLKNLPATTNSAVVEEFTNLGAKYVSTRVVDTGNIITAAGITSSIDLGIWLVERFASQDEAISISKRLEFERRGIVALPESPIPLK
jgi:transcriptional regulator GlxA family with amidase domain